MLCFLACGLPLNKCMPTDNFKKLPFYIQFTIKLAMLLLICVLIVFGHNILVPVVFSILLSILLLPLANFLERKLRFHRTLANFLSVLSAMAVIATLIYFFSVQLTSFLNDIPSIRQHLQLHYLTFQNWLEHTFNLSTSEQNVVISTATSTVKDTGSAVLGETFFTLTQSLIYVIMVAIYSFLILFYRHLIRNFLFQVFNESYKTDVEEVLTGSKVIVQKYMTGLMIEMAIVAILNSVTLMIIGVKYAIFLGVFSAVLNIIPYIGIIMGILITSLVTLTTSTHLSDIVWIIVCFEIIHFIDSNILMPRIVGSKIRINALVTIIGVVIGGTLIGLPGIFLALPTIAIMKIIFDRIPDLRAWGQLMGDDAYTEPRSNIIDRLSGLRFRKMKKKVSPELKSFIQAEQGA